MAHLLLTVLPITRYFAGLVVYVQFGASLYVLFTCIRWLHAIRLRADLSNASDSHQGTCAFTVGFRKRWYERLNCEAVLTHNLRFTLLPFRFCRWAYSQSYLSLFFLFYVKHTTGDIEMPARIHFTGLQYCGFPRLADFAAPTELWSNAWTF